MDKIKDILNKTILSVKDNIDGQLLCKKTGLNSIDNLLGGLENSLLYVIASRPSMGKSGLIEDLMLNQAINDNLNILYFAVEGNAKMLSLRLLSKLSKISIDKIRHGDISTDEWTHLEKSSTKLNETNLYIEDKSAIDIDELCKIAREKICKTDIIYIDFLQLITTSVSKTITNREQEIGYIVRRLKALVEELQIPIVLISQLNRAKEKEYRIPKLIDLRDSGVIEDVADIVLFIHRPEVYGIDWNEEGESIINKAQIIIAKNRYGSIGNCWLKFQDGCFSEIEGFNSEYNLGNNNFSEGLQL